MARSGLHARGFTLVEVLVAILILSIGLLGMAILQMRALTNNQSSLQRSMAVFLTYSIIDSMRADRVNALSGSYTLELDGTTPSGTSFADTRLSAWRTQIQEFLGSSATGGVSCENTACTLVTVTIQWDDSRGTESTSETTAAQTQQIATEVRL